MSEKNEIQMNNDRNIKKIPSKDEIVACVPKEAFKAMFYLFAGKPDSNVKLFRRRITLDYDDIVDLNEKIHSKFELHQIDQVVFSATIKYEKEKIMEFGSWAEFTTHDWKTPKITNELSLRWDFIDKALSIYSTTATYSYCKVVIQPKAKRNNSNRLFSRPR